MLTSKNHLHSGLVTLPVLVALQRVARDEQVAQTNVVRTGIGIFTAYPYLGDQVFTPR